MAQLQQATHQPNPTKRVVITGMSGVTALGKDWPTIRHHLLSQKTAIRTMPAWQKIKGMHTALGGPILDFTIPAHYPRKKLRAMGRVAQLATVASEAALEDAGLIEAPCLHHGRMGIAYGSCAGSSLPLADLVDILTKQSIRGVTATTYLKAMSHTCAVNIAVFFGITGRMIPTSTACTSSSQAVGYAYESIKYGLQDVMLAGGAEELCPSQAAIFDTLYATSQKNETPHLTPRPFDRDRDGLVLGEGACTLILEEYEHAKARSAKIYAEMMGFGTNCDAAHVTQPCSETMANALTLALEDAKLTPDAIDYVCAHGTATDRGDMAESHATASIIGTQTPISSLKSYFGHTLGACGALEVWLSCCMMRDQQLMPTLNLENPDPRCAPLNYLQHKAQPITGQYVMTNNFAFGGINTSIILKCF